MPAPRQNPQVMVSRAAADFGAAALFVMLALLAGEVAAVAGRDAPPLLAWEKRSRRCCRCALSALLGHAALARSGFRRGALDADLNELYTQWFADGLFFDVPARPHTENLCNCQETAPDRIGHTPSNLDNLRQRYELSPYLYSLAHRAYLAGEPVAPPLVYYYQSDPNVRLMADEKLLGRDLLLAAVAARGEVQHRVYLPAGRWANYYTGEWLDSDGEWFGPIPLYLDGKFKLPMFARAGAIIPQMYVDEHTMNALGMRSDSGVRNELVVQVYPDATPSQFTLYEDDGQTVAYQRGAVRTTVISQAMSDTRVTVLIEGVSGAYNGAPSIRNNIAKLVVDHQNGAQVMLNGQELRERQSQTDWEAASSGWRNTGNNVVLAKSGPIDVAQPKTFEFALVPGPEVVPTRSSSEAGDATPPTGTQPSQAVIDLWQFAGMVVLLVTVVAVSLWIGRRSKRHGTH